MQKPEPTKEHEWLRQLVGEWTFEHDSPAAPGEMPQKYTGTESVRMVGDVWVVSELRGQVPDGGVSTSLMTLGYDPQKQRFVGTFVASMMTNLWAYEGVLDAAGKVLTLDTLGPTFTGNGQMAKYQDIFELKSDGHRVLRSQMLGDDGKWHEFMTAHYRRER